MNKTNNLRAYLRDLYEGIVSKKPDASRNPQNFRSEIEAIRTGGELYEVMDASELPEDAPNGSLALVEGEPIPEAYTVSSVDELPSDAVDGSIAIVESDSIVGEWEWHETLDIMLDGIFEVGVKYTVEVEDGGNNNIMKPMYGIGLYFADGEIMGIYSNYPDQYQDYYEAGDWWYRSRKITFLEDNEELKNFIKTNAERLSGGYSLYTHENGEWVYKCEVA